MLLGDALAELGPALIGKGWIGELTERERWLVEKHNESRSSIIPHMISFVGPGGIPFRFDDRTELGAALNRDSTMSSQREQAVEWLEDRDLLFETADGDEVVPVAAFRAALNRAGIGKGGDHASPGASHAAAPPSSPRQGRGRGRRPEKLEAVKNVMLSELRSHSLTREALVKMAQKRMETRYGASRETCVKARAAALSEFVGN